MAKKKSKRRNVETSKQRGAERAQAVGPTPQASRRTAQASTTPAYFLSLTVKNVRCFGPEDQTLDLSDGHDRPAHWTVLLGNNGTGKTTLLECLALLAPFQAARALYRHVITTFTGGHYLRLGAAQGCYFRAVSVSGAKLTDYSKPLPTQKMRVDLSIGQPLVSLIICQGNVSLIPICFCYGVTRRMGSTSSHADDVSDDPTASLFDDRAELRNAEEWLLRLDYAATKESEIRQQQRERFELVRELLIRILPEVEDIHISEPTKDRPQPTVEFKTPDGWVPLRWIGYGYRTLLAWMVDLASRMVDRYPDSQDPLAEPAVVLVDEIDLHLHPRWQRTLMSYLSERFPNVQFIVTAHSPLFVQAAADANVVLLRRDEKKGYVVIENKKEVIKGWRVDQVLTSDLFGLETARPPQLDDLLPERKKLLTQPKLTKADKKRLAELEQQIGPLPVGETAQDARTMQLLEATLQVLQKKRSGKA